MSRRACEFNQTAWLRILERFPIYSSQLGGGIKSNILVYSEDVNNFDFIGSRNKKQGILGKTIECLYMNGDVLVATYTSLPGNIFIQHIYIYIYVYIYIYIFMTHL